jgi:transcription elongation factor Elf1
LPLSKGIKCNGGANMTISNQEYKKQYQCPTCKYVSAKTVLIIFEEIEYRFCAKCYLEFIKNNVPEVIELPTS